jgi:uncharacterized membrane protein YhaH (DUF805 family)
MERFSFVAFTLQGRINRRTWLGFALIIAVLGLLAELLIRRVFHLPMQVATPETPFLVANLGGDVEILTELIFLWPSLAIDVKRWHDLGRSGWTCLILYGPAAVLYVLEIGGFGGTVSHPDARVAVFFYVFGLIAVAYFIILAARRGTAQLSRFGVPPS